MKVSEPNVSSAERDDAADEESTGGGSGSFYIQHPKKSFGVVAPSPQLRKAWVRDISRAIQRNSRRRTQPALAVPQRY